MAASSEIRIAPLGAEGGAENRIGCQKKRARLLGALTSFISALALYGEDESRRSIPFPVHPLRPSVRRGFVSLLFGDSFTEVNRPPAHFTLQHLAIMFRLLLPL
jgi:hypothetical protein